LDFKTKFTSTRETNTKFRSNVRQLLFDYESDRGRIINSAAVRRLQQKTQVFPLERNSAVRSRLTHSLEVQQVGRFIVQSIFSELNSQEKLKQYGLDELERHFETIVEMSCLMHDIGNPPFGHFGEAAISCWFTKNVPKILSLNVGLQSLSPDLLNDICNFEGNAQAIRIVHTLLRLNLTFTQVAGIMKYTRCGTEEAPKAGSNFDYLKKKVGFYKSELNYVSTICAEFGIEKYHRHPATYVMEAADDISYCIADLEDAVEKGILTIKKLKEALCEEYLLLADKFRVREKLSAMDNLTEYAIKRANDESIAKESEFFVWLRVGFIHPLVNHAVTRFISNIEAIFDGSLNYALLEDHSYQHAMSQAFKNVAYKYAFCDKEVEERELQGYRIITGLLDCYKPLLELTKETFDLVRAQNKKAPLLEKRLFKKLSGKHVRAYEFSLKDGLSEEIEFYYRCRLIQDYISGMTDQFAYDEYRSLTVAD
jgi:dGTPase